MRYRLHSLKQVGKDGFKKEWININRLLGCAKWADMFILNGDRDCGKSYSVVNWALGRKIKNPNQVKWFWLRLSEPSVKSMLVNSGERLIDPDIVRKFKIDLKVKRPAVFYGKKIEIKKKNGEFKETFKNEGKLLDVLSISTFYNNKGSAFYDNEYNGEYIIILDEMNREDSERKTFDIIYNLKNQIENLTRDTQCKIYFFLIGNNVGEMSDILSVFNFVPQKFGIFKLKKKKVVIWNIEPNLVYQRRRENTLYARLSGDGKGITKTKTSSRLVSKEYKYPKNAQVLDFGNDNLLMLDTKNNVILGYHEHLDKASISRLAMGRHIKTGVFLPEVVNIVIKENYEKRLYKYENISVENRFNLEIKKIF